MAAAVEARRLLSQVVCAALVLVSGSQKTDRKVSQRDVGRCRAELLASTQVSLRTPGGRHRISVRVSFPLLCGRDGEPLARFCLQVLRVDAAAGSPTSADRLTPAALLLSPAVCGRRPDHTQVHQGQPRRLLPRVPADAGPARPRHLPPAVRPGGSRQSGV